MEASGFQLAGGSQSTGSYYDNKQAGLQIRSRASYDALRGFKAGQACIAFGEMVIDTQIFYCAPGFAKAMRVQRFVALPPPDEQLIRHAPIITKVRDLLVHKTWTAAKAAAKMETPDEIAAIAKALEYAKADGNTGRTQAGMAAVASVHILHNPDDLEASDTAGTASTGTGSTGGPALAAPPAPAAPVTPAAPVSPIASIIATRQPAATPPADVPPLTATPPSFTQASAETNQSASANPMSFFSKKPAATDEQPPAAVQPPAEQTSYVEPAPAKPINWEALINTPPQNPAPESQPTEQPPAQPAPQQPAMPPLELPDVDDETRAILDKAAKDLQDKLRGNDDGENNGQ